MRQVRKQSECACVGWEECEGGEWCVCVKGAGWAHL